MDDNEKKSQFNAGVALAERIDLLQQIMNSGRFNPLAINPETMTYNYQIMIETQEALFTEAWSKLTPQERKTGARLCNLIQEFLEYFPPVTIQPSGQRAIDVDNYKMLMKLLFHFEKKNKEFLDAHNLNAPNVQEGIRF